MIIIVYHAYLVGDWINLVQKQLNRLKKSGLYTAADKIFMTVNLSEDKKNDLLSILKKYEKINVDFFYENHAEYPAIKKIKEIGEEYDAKIFYFHTKGVSNNWKTFNDKEFSDEKNENVNLWRESMEYFLIDKWKECINALESYDNVGMTCNGGWFWGNFWWSKSEHIKKTENVSLWGRWDYEAWLNKNTPNAKNYEFFHIDYNPYVSKIHAFLYNGEINKFKGNKIVLKKAIYGTPPFEIDEGYSTMPTSVIKDVTSTVEELLKENNHLKFDFLVNNETMNGDPIWGHRKCLIIEFHPEGEPDKIIQLGVTENSNMKFEF